MQKQISKTELVGKTTFFQMSCCFLRGKLLFASCLFSLAHSVEVRLETKTFLLFLYAASLLPNMYI